MNAGNYFEAGNFSEDQIDQGVEFDLDDMNEWFDLIDEDEGETAEMDPEDFDLSFSDDADEEDSFTPVDLFGTFEHFDSLDLDEDCDFEDNIRDIRIRMVDRTVLELIFGKENVVQFEGDDAIFLNDSAILDLALLAREHFEF